MAHVRFFENHQSRSGMPLSSRTRRSPHEYTIRVTLHIVETPSAMGMKKIERAGDFGECGVSVAQVGGYANWNAEYFPALGIAKEPEEDPISQRLGPSVRRHLYRLNRSLADGHDVGPGRSAPELGSPSHKHIARSTIPNCAFPSVPRCRTSLA
jgi:hypothetical protein